MKQVLIIFLIAFAIKSNSQSVLKMNLGDTYSILNKMTTDVNTEAMGQSIQMKNDFTFNISTSVISKPANRLILNSKVTAVSGLINGAGQNMNFNSAKGQMNGPIAKMFEPIINKDYPKVFDNMGIFIDSSISKLTDEESAAFKQVGLTTTDPIIFNKGLISKDFVIGKKWQDSTSSKGKVNNKTATSFIVDKIVQDTAFIKYTSKESFDGIVEQMGAKMDMSGTKETNGVYKVLITNSIIQANDYISEMETTLQYMGNDIPVKSKIVGSIIIIPVK